MVVKNGPEIRVSRSDVGLREALAAARVILRGFLGTGPETQKFEQELSAFLGHKAVCVVNGTSAIQLALQALGVGEGDEVLVPSLTYVATYQAISATGARPVSCEVYPESLTIDLQDAASRMSEATKAIVPVHYGGEVRGRSELAEFAKTHKLAVVEDAAHAFGSMELKGKLPEPIDLTVYSFDGIKNITSGEGGCVVGDDEVILERVRDLRLLGVEGDSLKRYAGERSWDFQVRSQGWRYHMSDVMASIGRIQLRKFHSLARRRRNLASYYDQKLSVTPVKYFHRDYKLTVPHIYPILLPPGVSREALIRRMAGLGIQLGIHYKPNHQLDFFSRATKLPITEELSPRLVSLPLHPRIKRKQIDRIVEEVSSFISEELNAKIID